MQHGTEEADGGAASWVDGELAACDLGDRRLVERLRCLLRCLGAAIGQPLPLACQDWAGTKAAHRFFANGRFGEDAILSGHFAATAARCAACDGLLLVVQGHHRADPQMGQAGRPRRNRPRAGRARPGRGRRAARTPRPAPTAPPPPAAWRGP